MLRQAVLLGLSSIAAMAAAGPAAAQEGAAANQPVDAGALAGEQDEGSDALSPSLQEPVRPVDAIETITVTATGLRTSIANTGQAITLIGREEIERVQGADLARVLARVPSATVSRSGPVGALSSLSLRGAGNEQLLVLLDGVRVADPASPAGAFDFGTLLAGNVGRLDILRGSNSTIWGSDAVGGVIEITTRREAGLGGAVEYGARDTLFASAVGGFESERGFASLSGSYHRTDGFSAAARGMEEDGFEQRAFAGSAFFDVTPEIELFAHGRFADGELDIDSFSFDPPFLPVDSAEVQETRQFSGAVGAAYYGLDLTLRGFYSLADTERDNYAGPDASEPLFASDGKSQRAVLRGEYRLIGGLSLAFGGEHERTEYETSFADPAKVNITGAYGQLGWVLGRLAIHAGARVDDHELFGSEWSFGGDVSYGLGQDWRLKASVGEGFKAPTLFQLFSDFGNRELAPERSTSFDIGIERGLRGGPFHAALTLFRRDSENLIDFAFTGEAPGGTYFNIGEARAQGIELELAARPVNALSVAAVYALVDTEDRTASALTLGNELARRPRHALTVYADWLTPLAGLILGGDLRLVGDSFDDAANARPLEGYALLDLRASMPLGERLELFGRVENVFDAEYQTVLGYGQAGRGAFAGIRLAL